MHPDMMIRIARAWHSTMVRQAAEMQLAAQARLSAQAQAREQRQTEPAIPAQALMRDLGHLFAARVADH